MKLSVIVPTYNKLPRLKLMLESVKLQTLDRSEYELLFIVDGSTDGTSEYLEEWAFQTRTNIHQFSTENHGRAASRNRGIELTSGTYLVFTDDDLILSPQFFERHLKVMESHGPKSVGRGYIYNLPLVKFFRDPSDPNSLLEMTQDTQRTHSAFDSVVIVLDDITNRFAEKIHKQGRVTRFEKGVRYMLSSPSPIAPWIACTGGNFCIKKSELIKTGGFDEGFGLNWGCEDLELGYRLFRQGFQFIACPEAANFHLAHFRAGYKQEQDQSFAYFTTKYKDHYINELYLFLNDEESIQSYEKRMRAGKFTNEFSLNEGRMM